MLVARCWDKFLEVAVFGTGALMQAFFQSALRFLSAHDVAIGKAVRYGQNCYDGRDGNEKPAPRHEFRLDITDKTMREIS